MTSFGLPAPLDISLGTVDGDPDKAAEAIVDAVRGCEGKAMARISFLGRRRRGCYPGEMLKSSGSP